MSRAPLRSAAAFASGLLFAVGLGIAGMTRPSKVLGFLDLLGTWDPSLAFVMGGAVAVGLVATPLILRRASPVLASRFLLPARRAVDARLLLGAALFGAGWGLAGVCPGPAIVSAVTGAGPFLVFVAAMAAGIVAADHFAGRRVADADAAGTASTGAESRPRASAEAASGPRADSQPAPPPSAAVETTCG